MNQKSTKDQLTCAVSGSIEIATSSAFEYAAMKTGKVFPQGGYLPNNFSPVDLFEDDPEQTKIAKTHIVNLTPGDCIYIPSHWWF